MNQSISYRWVFIVGAAFAMLSVVFGAFSAHALKSVLDEGGLKLIDTAARYQMYHALALLFCGVLLQLRLCAESWIKVAAYLFTAGIFLFSGALYLIALSNIKWFGAIAPIGGTAFISGWLVVIIAIAKSK
ncbi:DUF423 domain-containing protein [Aliikangiella coralliicola]|uniref:DUF423 domain-containing protein n=1 Tax=Aliikangiella coralliicola TaxID=2592383 RepID=A0A545UH25_9GAMM|nr:DUF423 domain-containing protein [Aliikangiella coralliicola]TQV88765.1 DUF423 domain-containing protein [Aliikangiella coralliicola]